MIADLSPTLLIKLLQIIDLDSCIGLAQELALMTLHNELMLIFLLNIDFRSKWT